MENFKVLIVEDDPKVASVNRRFLEKLDRFTVVGIAASGQEALEAIQTAQPELILLDVYLPQVDGVRILKELRRMDVPVDVILITAARDTSIIDQALRFGAVDYIIKPFSFSRFASALERYCRLKRHLSGGQNLEQNKLDSILDKNAETELPKGLDNYTLDKVLQCLALDFEPSSAEKVAELMGISRITARRYLEYLAHQGKVKVDLVYGSVGRPGHLYSLC